MARHLAPEKTKTIKKPQLRLQALPKVIHFRFGEERRQYEREFSLRSMLPVLLAALLFLLGFLLRGALWVKLLLLGLSALCAAFDPLRRCLLRVVNGRLPDEELLVMIAVVIAFCIGEYAAGAFAMLMLRAGELCQAYVLARAENGVELLRDILPEKARVERDGACLDTVPEAVEPGDILLVQPGETIALDGEVFSGMSSVDCSPITGDEQKVNVSIGSTVRAGCVNVSAPLRIRVTKDFGASTAATRLESFEAARAMDSRFEKRLRRYSAIYLLASSVLALLLGLIVPLFTGRWVLGLRQAVIVLLLCSPCALLISVPLCFEGALVCSERRGMRVFGKSCVERLAKLHTMVFGKTGVITDGRFRVTDVFPDGVSERELLAIAAAAESHSLNPIGEALRQAGGWTKEMGAGVMQIEEIPGRGVSAFIEGRHVYVGNAALLEEHGIWYQTPNRVGSAIHVAVENRYWGHILLSDRLREGAFDALEDLRAQGVNQTVLLTGDVLSVTRNVASALNFDMVRGELSPEGKRSAVAYLLRGMGDGSTLAYVGDGIHDAPLFDDADVGISLDSLRYDDGRDKADVAVMSGDIRRLPMLLQTAKTAWRVSWQNIILCCAVKALLLILAVCSAVPVSIAAAVDALVAVLTALNALRPFIGE